MKKSLRNILLGISAGLTTGAFSLFGMNSAIAQNYFQLPEDKAPQTETVFSFDEGKTITMNADGSKSWDGEHRHWHVTPEGDTIVSWKDKKTAEKYKIAKKKKQC